MLGFLMDDALSGYDIKAKFELSVSNFYNASFGAIYPALRKMEQDGLVEKKVVPQEGKPNKNLYQITDSGRETFLAYLNSPLEAALVRSDFLIRVFFARYAAPEQFRGWMEEERIRVQASLDTFREIKRRYPSMDPFEAKTLEFGIANAQMQIEWLDREIDLLGKDGMEK
ncbi:PadR family transcriptional regulator [Alicyclobacillus dauci]|uniref:PadR family transcriptional regulator n=1 Tax=Alicyclobacillus dauci TaxID=1475485 RepID=A0ABY6Z8K0_9BACL|nr:PadR family transcriptional regulator [Alicyclobacillus dauci]WAH39184.1 PadR family transcriptional regulator [Alicyclobacillus dauci]